MTRAVALLFLAVCGSLIPLRGQDRVAPEMMYHKVWAVVPIIGKGTADDPKRPMFTLSPGDLKAQSEADQAEFLKTGKKKDPEAPAVLSYTMQVSDDGKSALVEFTGLNPQTLAFITGSKAPGEKAFERGKATKVEIETEFKKAKANFKLEDLGRGK